MTCMFDTCLKLLVALDLSRALTGWKYVALTPFPSPLSMETCSRRVQTE